MFNYTAIHYTLGHVLFYGTIAMYWNNFLDLLSITTLKATFVKKYRLSQTTDDPRLP